MQKAKIEMYVKMKTAQKGLTKVHGTLTLLFLMPSISGLALFFFGLGSLCLFRFVSGTCLIF
jgi:hypothetical protein